MLDSWDSIVKMYKKHTDSFMYFLLEKREVVVSYRKSDNSALSSWGVGILLQFTVTSGDECHNTIRHTHLLDQTKLYQT